MLFALDRTLSKEQVLFHKLLNLKLKEVKHKVFFNKI
jgi:hypothetical protein